MNKKTQTPEQPELLWVDEKNLNKEQIKLLRSQTALNNFIKECKNVLKSELSDELKHKLRDLKINALIVELKKQFPFPNATDDFNLQSLGVDLNNAKRISSSEDWELFRFDLSENGDFIGSEDQKMFDQYYYYVTSEHRKKTLELAKRLVDLSNDANKAGLLDFNHLGAVALAFGNMVMIDGEPFRTGAKLKVNNKAIAVSTR